MRISVAGSKPQRFKRRPRGFTLIELLVVLSIIAIASAGVAFAMRDSAQTQLEREAQRLSALLESARAKSRTSGVAVFWRSTEQGFTFDGLPPGSLPGNWLDSNTRVTRVTPATPGNRLELGPEPIVGAQSVTLGNGQQGSVTLRVVTDGLRTFAVQMDQSAVPAEAAP
jgi:general secretion pathway protein H